VLDDLRRATQPGEAALAAASTPREQSQAATGLAADYEGAADKLAVGGTDPGVTSALRQIGAAYRMAGAAALRGDAVGFRAAGANVDDGRKALDQALAGVPAGATVPPPASQQPAVSGGSTGSSSPGDSSGSGGSTGSSSGSGGSGGANENEPDENDNGN
jgi:hypothetical protein